MRAGEKIKWWMWPLVVVQAVVILSGLAWLADRAGQNIDRRIADQFPAICQAEPWRRYEEQCR